MIVQIAVLPIPLSDKEKGVGIWEFTEERTNDFTSIQQEEESPVNTDIYDPRPHSPQSLSDKLTSAGISDELKNN